MGARRRRKTRAPPSPLFLDLTALVLSLSSQGVHEKDDVRKDDSFASFDEVLGLATTHGADAVLLGGDLFHENKPSREAVVRAMTSLSSACLVGGEGDHGQHGAPASSSSSHPGVRFDIISPNPGADFAAGAPNFTAPGHRVRLPVFSIHGNHDDPVGPGSLSAVDVLSSAGLVNYFGKRALEGSAGSTVVMSPILLQKVREAERWWGWPCARRARCESGEFLFIHKHPSSLRLF
jgi:double-strand break repair protein MRE11